jgi:hypothetical protein
MEKINKKETDKKQKQATKNHIDVVLLVGITEFYKKIRMK